MYYTELEMIGIMVRVRCVIVEIKLFSKLYVSVGINSLYGHAVA